MSFIRCQFPRRLGPRLVNAKIHKNIPFTFYWDIELLKIQFVGTGGNNFSCYKYSKITKKRCVPKNSSFGNYMSQNLSQVLKPTHLLTILRTNKYTDVRVNFSFQNWNGENVTNISLTRKLKWFGTTTTTTFLRYLLLSADCNYGNVEKYSSFSIRYCYYVRHSHHNKIACECEHSH